MVVPTRWVLSLNSKSRNEFGVVPCKVFSAKCHGFYWWKAWKKQVLFDHWFFSLGLCSRLRLFRKWKWRPRRLPQGFLPKKAQWIKNGSAGQPILRKHTHQATLLTNQLCNVKLVPLKRKQLTVIFPNHRLRRISLECSWSFFSMAKKWGWCIGIDRGPHLAKTKT